jgi:hypothetical protein
MEGGAMGTRNTPIFQEILEVFSPDVANAESALTRLEIHFQHRLIVEAGSVASVRSSATQLRLHITDDECSAVLDEIARRGMVGVTVDHVEETVYDLFGNRFIEPEE